MPSNQENWLKCQYLLNNYPWSCSSQSKYALHVSVDIERYEYLVCTKHLGSQINYLLTKDNTPKYKNNRDNLIIEVKIF